MARQGDDRVFALDFLRGVAVMGILLLNIVSFSLPPMASINPASFGGYHGADRLAWLLNFVFADGKMRGLFSLLFGASMMVIAARARSNGESPSAVHYRRMAWLAAIGLAHFFLIWFGDILFLYAMVGAIAFVFRRLEPSRLIILALVIYTLGALINIVLFMGPMLMAQWATQADAANEIARARFAEMMSDPEINGASIPAMLDLYRGGWTDIFLYKFTHMWALPFTGLMKIGPETLPLMLLGMGLYGNGFIIGHWPVRSYRKIGIRLTLIGTIGFSALAWAIIASHFDMVITLNAWFAWALIPRLVMTIGYAALLLMLAKPMRGTAIGTRIAATGRMALSNYIGTSLAMTALFYGWGFGLYGQLSRAQLYLVVLAMWAMMLLWSKPWLHHFRYGPLEWLWRSVARGKWQAMHH